MAISKALPDDAGWPHVLQRERERKKLSIVGVLHSLSGPVPFGTHHCPSFCWAMQSQALHPSPGAEDQMSGSNIPGWPWLISILDTSLPKTCQSGLQIHIRDTAIFPSLLFNQQFSPSLHTFLSLGSQEVPLLLQLTRGEGKRRRR